MKKLQILVVALVLSTSSLLAHTDPKPETASMQLRTQIIELLGTPDLELQQDVLENEIEFMVTAQGSIVVLNVTTENPAIENYIKNRLNYKEAKVAVGKNKFFNLSYKIVKEI